MTKTIMLASGGTGGHIFPAKALAHELESRGYSALLVTDKRYQNIASDNMSNVLTIDAASPSRGGAMARIFSLGKIILGTMQAIGHIRRYRPACVVGFGGYPSLPTMIAALLLRYPTVIHEQNAVMGRVNRLIASRVRGVATGFEKVKHHSRKPRVKWTGNPVRDPIRAIHKKPYKPPTSKQKLRILITGGSQGTQVFSHVIPDALKQLTKDQLQRLSIVQQCREEDLAQVQATYKELGIDHQLSSFFNDMAKHLEDCHLCIMRAGASTIAEITTVGRPALLVPYPYAVDNHQYANALSLGKNEAALVCEQSKFTPKHVATIIQSFLDAPRDLETIAINAFDCGKLDASVRLADFVEQIAKDYA